MSGKEIVYLKCERNIEVKTQDVCLGDMGSVYCENGEICARLQRLRVYHFDAQGAKRCVISCISLIARMEEAVPGIVVQVVGETDVLVERVEVKRSAKWIAGVQIPMVCLVSFFGTAFAIMSYHNDVGINEVFAQVYRIIMGREPGGLNTLEVSYAIGLALGIIVFFNHVGGRRITKDPTPIEVALRNYEEDVDKTLIATASREGKELDI